MESKNRLGGRKTPATYGKSARRKLLNYTSKSSNITMDDSYVKSYDFEGNANEQISKDVPLLYSIQGRRTARTPGYTDYSIHRDSQSNISKKNPAVIEDTNPQAHRSSSLYDVPSSEDEISSAYNNQSHPVIKRKRVCRGVVGQEIDIVYEKKKTPRSDSNECVSEPPAAADLSEHEALQAHPSGKDDEYSFHHHKQSARKSMGTPRSQNRRERTKNPQTHRETFQHRRRLGFIKHYPPNHGGPNLQIQGPFTTPTQLAVPTHFDGLRETQNFSNDINVQEPRCEISSSTVLRTPPYDAKTQNNTYIASGSTALLASRTDAVIRVNSDTSSVPGAYTSAKTQGFAPSVLSITEESAAAQTARPGHSRARIVDRLSSTKCGNFGRKNQGFGREHTEAITTQIEVPRRKGVASSSDIEEYGFSSAEDQNLPSDRCTTLPLRAPKSVAIPNNESLQVTYARQRSYLTESDLSNDMSFSIPIVVPDVSIATRNIDRISAQPPHESWDEADDHEDGPCNSIRSIHELREAGGTARVISDMEAILDDIDIRGGAQPSYLRNCLLDLAMKLEDSANCRLLLDRGLEARLIKHINPRSDSITNKLLMASLLRLMKSSYTPNILTLMSDSFVLEFLGAFLGKIVNDASFDTNDPSNIPKIIRAEGSKCFNSLLKSSIWSYGQPLKISTRVLALQCLEYIARHAREASGKLFEISQRKIADLVEIAVPSRSDLVICQDVMIEIRLAISILESTLTSAHTSSESTHWSNSSVERMTQLLPVLKILTGENLGEPGTLALRLCLNFTNSNRVRCEAFAKTELIDAVMSIITSCFDQLTLKLPIEQQAQVSDQLVLALGLLINIAEWNENARKLFLIPDTGRQISLDTLMQLFNTNLSRAPEVILPMKANLDDSLTSQGDIGAGNEYQCSLWLSVSVTRLSKPHCSH